MPMLSTATSRTLHVRADLWVIGSVCSLHYWYRKESGPDPAHRAYDLQEAWHTDVRPKLLAFLSNGAVLMRVNVWSVWPIHEAPSSRTYDDTATGSVAGEVLPAEIAMLFRLECDSANFRNNRHHYVPGIPEDDWVAGVWDGAVLAVDPQAYGLQLKADLVGASGATYRPVVLSRYDGGIKRPDPVTFDLINAYIISTASQQRKRGSDAKQFSP